MAEDRRDADRLEAKRQLWDRLERLAARVEHEGFSSLSREELNELGRLHRRVSAHLARAQSGPSDRAVVEYLNRLVLRSHNLIYRTRVRFRWSSVGRFLLRGFPDAVFRCRACVAVALLVFYGVGLVAFGVTYVQPAYARLFIPPIFSGMDPETIGDEGWLDELTTGEQSMLSSFIMTNNIRQGIMAFAGGILLGTLTVYSLVTNGMMVGGIAGLVHSHGRALPFWAVILPHGVIELTAFCICGAAGLRLAGSLIAPGPYTRRDSLARAAPDALRLALGTIPMFVIAGLIEGFISPSPLPARDKLVFSAVWGILLLSYFGSALWRKANSARDPSSDIRHLTSDI